MKGGENRKFTRPLPTQSSKAIDRKTEVNERHTRIFRSMQYSDAFKDLTGNAIRLYLHLRMKFHKEEEEDRDFAFSKSLGIKVFGLSANSEKTIKRALKNLIKCGFIEPTYISQGGGKKNKKPNRFKFSTNWYDYKSNKKN